MKHLVDGRGGCEVCTLDYFDYWQEFCPVHRGLKNRFGVRIQGGKCWPLVQIGNDEPATFGTPHQIPVDLSTLPLYIRIILENHRLICPDSDVFDVLAGQLGRRRSGLAKENGA